MKDKFSGEIYHFNATEQAVIKFINYVRMEDLYDLE